MLVSLEFLRYCNGDAEFTQYQFRIMIRMCAVFAIYVRRKLM